MNQNIPKRLPYSIFANPFQNASESATSRFTTSPTSPITIDSDDEEPSLVSEANISFKTQHMDQNTLQLLPSPQFISPLLNTLQSPTSEFNKSPESANVQDSDDLSDKAVQKRVKTEKKAINTITDLSAAIKPQKKIIKAVQAPEPCMPSSLEDTIYDNYSNRRLDELEAHFRGLLSKLRNSESVDKLTSAVQAILVAKFKKCLRRAQNLYTQELKSEKLILLEEEASAQMMNLPPKKPIMAEIIFD